MEVKNEDNTSEEFESWIPFGREQMWDSGWLISDQGNFSSVFSILTGDHSRPAWLSLIAYVTYWVVALTLYRCAAIVRVS